MIVVVAEPAAEVLTAAECKAHLRVDFDDDDVLIAGLARAAEQHLAAPAGWVGRSIGLQLLELRCGGFDWPCGLDLPYGPVTAVEAVTYDDRGGVEQSLAGDVYRVANEGTVLARLMLRSGKAWPPDVGDGGVRVRYRAGYEAENVPVPLKQAMLLLVGLWYEQREEAVVDAIVSRIPFAVEALATPYRLWSF